MVGDWCYQLEYRSHFHKTDRPTEIELKGILHKTRIDFSSFLQGL